MYKLLGVFILLFSQYAFSSQAIFLNKSDKYRLDVIYEECTYNSGVRKCLQQKTLSIEPKQYKSIKAISSTQDNESIEIYIRHAKEVDINNVIKSQFRPYGFPSDIIFRKDEPFLSSIIYFEDNNEFPFLIIHRSTQVLKD